MKMMIDGGGLVTDEVALLMVAKIVDRPDSIVRFTGGLAVEVKTTKTQKAFRVVTLPDGDDTSK